MKQNLQFNLEIAAHTDDVGSDNANLKLSEARAKSVVDYMLSEGIDEKRLIAKGYGETDPMVPNNSTQNRALNRRVEFRVPKE